VRTVTLRKSLIINVCNIIQCAKDLIAQEWARMALAPDPPGVTPQAAPGDRRGPPA